MSNNDSEFCESLAAPVGSPFRYASYKLPADQRDALRAIQALHVELDNVLHTIVEPHVAKARLDWWREELGRVETGGATHPISRALTQARQRQELPLEYLEQRLEGAIMDTRYTGYQTEQDLAFYLSQTGGALWQLFGLVLGLDRQTSRPLHRLGVADRRLRLLQYMGRDLAAGRIYLPAQRLEAAGVTPADLMLPDPPTTVQTLLEQEAGRLDTELATIASLLAKAGQTGHRRALWPARVILGIDRALLAKIRRDGTRVLERRVELAPIHQLLISAFKQWQKA